MSVKLLKLKAIRNSQHHIISAYFVVIEIPSKIVGIPIRSFIVLNMQRQPFHLLLLQKESGGGGCLQTPHKA